jgi:hypothetical protein
MSMRATLSAGAPAQRLPGPRALLARAFAANAPLTLVGLAMLLTLAAALVGLVVDRQVITGVPAWVKPAKFAISTAIYSFTLIYLLTFIRGHRRLVSVAAGVTALGLFVEVALIVAQVARGTTSHFNFTTPLDAAIFSTMGGFIVAVWTMGLIVAFLLWRQGMPDPAWAWALRLGASLSLVGMAVAFLMTQPKPGQIAAAQAGGPRIIGAHSVGVADGGPGLPFLGWSTVAGDLRVPHFFGLHGLQAMLIVGFLLTLPAARARLSAGRRAALVWAAGLGYFGLIALLTWQALRGQPLIHPDGATLAAGGALLVAVIIAVAGIVLGGWRDVRLSVAPSAPRPE